MASVRATIMTSASTRASAAALMRCSISRDEATLRPGSWPHFLGHSWSSSWTALTPARSKLAHGADDVERAAIAGVGVGDHRDGNRIADAAHAVQNLAEAQGAHVRRTERAHRDA